ncbi:hypothetical protein QQ045_006844 [Rhodiola kirilowii]
MCFTNILLVILKLLSHSILLAQLFTGFLYADSFSGITEETFLNSLTQVSGSNKVDVSNICLPNFPKPPNAFRGISRKSSALKRWLAICADDSVKDGKYRPITNLLHKYLWDYLIASYLDMVQESGHDNAYVKEIEDDYAADDEEYEAKLKKESIALFFLAF